MYKGLVSKRLRLSYVRQLMRPSEACGTELRIFLQDILLHDFQSAEIKAALLSSSQAAHVDITL